MSEIDDNEQEDYFGLLSEMEIDDEDTSVDSAAPPVEEPPAVPEPVPEIPQEWIDPAPVATAPLSQQAKRPATPVPAPPDPVPSPPAAPEELPIAPLVARKKPLELRTKPIPASPEQAAPAAPQPVPHQTAKPTPQQVPQQARGQIAKKKGKQHGKKKQPVAKPQAQPHAQPQPQPHAQRPQVQPVAARVPAPARPQATPGGASIGAAVKALLLLAWVGIAVLGYFTWQQRDRLNQAKTAVGVPQEVVDDLADKLAATSSRIEELEGLRELQRYGNEAIIDGHRSALYKLDEYFKNPKIQSLKETAVAEIIRVETYYLTTRAFRAFPERMPVISESDPVTSLGKILVSPEQNWTVRAGAATLLSKYEKNITAADALAEASQSDPNLYVVDEAIRAFNKVTGFRETTGVFDHLSLTRWWNENRAKFAEESKNAPATADNKPEKKK